MFEVNEIGFLRDKFVRKEALKILIIGPLFSIIYLTLSYISMIKWAIFFYAASPFLLLIVIFLFIIAPIKMLKRHNRTIKRIKFEEEFIIISVFSALWMKSKEYKFNRNTLKVRDSKFYWYGKQIKEGLILKDKDEYYLVLEYFTESEDIKKQLI